MKQSRETANDVRNLTITFVGLLVYINIVIGSTTHEQLLRVSSVSLPLLGVNLPIVGFFLITPVLILLLHVNLLVQHFLLSQQLFAFSSRLQEVQSPKRRQELLRNLGHLPFVHWLIGYHHGWVLRMLLAIVVHFSLIIWPLASLLWLELAFLPYHSPEGTGLQKISLLLDGLFTIWIWPKILHPQDQALRWWGKSIIGLYRGTHRTWLNIRAADPRRTSKPNQFRIVGSPLFLASVCGLLVGWGLSVATLPDSDEEAFWLRLSPMSWRTDCLGRITLTLTCAMHETGPEWASRNLIVREAILTASPLEAEGRSTLGKGASPTNDVLRRIAGIDLRNRDLRYADLSGSSLPKADLRGANLMGARLVGTRFNGATLGDDAETTATRDGVASDEGFMAWLASTLYPKDTSRPSTPVREPISGSRAIFNLADLTGSQMTGAVAYRAKFHGAIMTGASLQGMQLRSAEMYGAILNCAQLDGADLSDADLHGADLRGAMLRGTNLNQTRLIAADLRNARLDGADFRSATLSGANLSRAQLDAADFSLAQYRGQDQETLRTTLDGILRNVEDAFHRRDVLLANSVERAIAPCSVSLTGNAYTRQPVRLMVHDTVQQRAVEQLRDSNAILVKGGFCMRPSDPVPEQCKELAWNPLLLQFLATLGCDDEWIAASIVARSANDNDARYGELGAALQRKVTATLTPKKREMAACSALKSQLSKAAGQRRNPTKRAMAEE